MIDVADCAYQVSASGLSIAEFMHDTNIHMRLRPLEGCSIVPACRQVLRCAFATKSIMCWMACRWPEEGGATRSHEGLSK